MIIERFPKLANNRVIYYVPNLSVGTILGIDCTWVETYDLGFSPMNEELTRQGRTQEWVKICFAGK